MEINNVHVDPFHSHMLDELVNALENGKGVLNEILGAAAVGSNHLPGPGELQRALVEQDVHAICNRMLSRQALTQEALRAKKEAEQKIKEAQSNMEEALKLVDAAKQEEERLKAQLEVGMRVTIDNLANHPGGGPQRVPNGNGGAGT